jgi:hypothetical protein
VTVEDIVAALEKHDIFVWHLHRSTSEPSWTCRLCDAEHHRRLLGKTGTLMRDGWPPFYQARGPSMLAAISSAAAKVEAQLGITVMKEKSPLT